MLLARMGEARVAEMPEADPAAHLIANIRASAVAMCGMDDAGVVTMCGVLPTDHPEIGYVWQIITDVAAHKREYLKQNRALISQMATKYGKLVTVIEADYPAAIRHAKHLGFTVSEPMEIHGRMAVVCERSR